MSGAGGVGGGCGCAGGLVATAPSYATRRRCKVTTVDQYTGEMAEPAEGELEAEPLATLRRAGYRKNADGAVYVGQNMAHQWSELERRPAAARVVRVGDSVHVLEDAAVPPF